MWMGWSHITTNPKKNIGWIVQIYTVCHWIGKHISIYFILTIYKPYIKGIKTYKSTILNFHWIEGKIFLLVFCSPMIFTGNRWFFWLRFSRQKIHGWCRFQGKIPQKSGQGEIRCFKNVCFHGYGFIWFLVRSFACKPQVRNPEEIWKKRCLRDIIWG